MNRFRKTELAIATGLYLLIVFMLVSNSISNNVFELQHEYGYKFDQYHQVFDYYKHYLLPILAHVTIIYLAFIFIHARVVPEYLERQRWFLGILFTGIVCGTVFLVIMISYTWYYGYLFGVYNTVRGVYTHCLKQAFILTIFYSTVYILYYAGRRLYFDFVFKQIIQQSWFRERRIEVTVMLTIIGFVLLSSATKGPAVMLILLAISVFYCYVYFICEYKIFPRFAIHQNKREVIREVSVISLPALMLIGLLVLLARHPGPFIIFIMLATYAVEAIVIVPITWWVYKTRHQRVEEVKVLQKALDHSEAGLDFLRWQINPHFLFNALNTLYGTALIERATATGEGIQKLGDMMRFMLHDNVLPAIPLDKEIAYLQNYIVLQRLRTKGSPDILIEVNINETNCEHEIAPMLLIPFVENAFKYGVSQRNKSRITVSLSCTADKIYFDVYNTIHLNRSQDVENDSMGIGLNNVRQRLALLYPDKHELSIRETGTEFFVHLTIQIV